MLVHAGASSVTTTTHALQIILKISTSPQHTYIHTVMTHTHSTHTRVHTHTHTTTTHSPIGVCVLVSASSTYAPLWTSPSSEVSNTPFNWGLPTFLQAGRGGGEGVFLSLPFRWPGGEVEGRGEGLRGGRWGTGGLSPAGFLFRGAPGEKDGGRGAAH